PTSTYSLSYTPLFRSPETRLGLHPHRDQRHVAPLRQRRSHPVGGVRAELPPPPHGGERAPGRRADPLRALPPSRAGGPQGVARRSEEHTSELQSREKI